MGGESKTSLTILDYHRMPLILNVARERALFTASNCSLLGMMKPNFLSTFWRFLVNDDDSNAFRSLSVAPFQFRSDKSSNLAFKNRFTVKRYLDESRPQL